jgi:hypothetical protein
MKNKYGVTEGLRQKIARMSYTEKVERAVKIIKDGEKRKMQCVAVMGYLIDGCGLSMTEYLEALNIAGNGELLKVALGED